VPLDQQPITESAPFAPRSFYGVSKAAGVFYLDIFAEVRNVRCVSLALGNVYGPRQDPHGESGVVAIFADTLLADGTCTVNGDGRTSRDFIYVRDVAQAFVLATRTGRGLMNIGTGAPATVLEIYDGIATLVGATRDRLQFGPPLPGEVRSVALDPARAWTMLGWRPETTLANGLRETVEWFGGLGERDQ